MTAEVEVGQLPGKFATRIRRDVPLAEYTTFGIGGPAQLLAEIESTDDLAELIGSARAAGIKTTILGEGSNLLIGDRGIKGLVIVNRCRSLARDGKRITAEAGAHLNDLVDFAVAEGLAGLEKLAGIPGSIGGAVVGNAGAYGQSIADVLEGVRVLDTDSRTIDLSGEQLGFAYRTSRLKTSGEIVLDIRLILSPADSAVLRKSADEIIARRDAKLPPGDICAGSYFKNIEDPSAPYGKIAAGRLLEEAGAKSFTVGQAAVSDRHANVIVNLGGASAADVLALAEKMKVAVFDKFGVELEEEVRFLGM